MTTLRASPFLLTYPNDVIVKVQSYNADGWSANSSLSATGATMEDVPVQMAAPTEVSGGPRQVIVAFTTLTGTSQRGDTITKYALEYKKTADSSYTVIDSVTSPVTVSSLVTSTSYMYRVKAYNKHGYSTQSNVLTVTTDTDVPDAPTNVAVAKSTNGLGFSITWNDGASLNGLAVTKYLIWVR